MKIQIEIDCTPEEAREFLGLPNVAAMQERFLGDLDRKMREAVESGDPQQLLSHWLPLNSRNLEQWETMWKQMAMAASQFQKAAREKKDTKE